mmetsp:Transcript_93647/g.166634  ORF Transcript_93647/g.166634 Transcript_93647/m.166634 type:complete len:250 (-) Transcript_93647:995-1744(-)
MLPAKTTAAAVVAGIAVELLGVVASLGVMAAAPHLLGLTPACFPVGVASLAVERLRNFRCPCRFLAAAAILGAAVFLLTLSPPGLPVIEVFTAVVEWLYSSWIQDLGTALVLRLAAKRLLSCGPVNLPPLFFSIAVKRLLRTAKIFVVTAPKLFLHAPAFLPVGETGFAIIWLTHRTATLFTFAAISLLLLWPSTLPVVIAQRAVVCRSRHSATNTCEFAAVLLLGLAPRLLPVPLIGLAVKRKTGFAT